MTCRSSGFLVLAACVLALPGCTNLFAKRAIEQFAESLQAQDLAQLKVATSEHFEQKALRQEDAARGLKMLRLPTGEVEIVSVEELSKTTWRAVVKVGEKDRQQEIEYRLSRDAERGRWVVDDVIMKQDSGRGKIVQRSVTEQMDLLLTCRELLVSWKEGERAEKLSFCDDELRTELERLPEPWLTCLSAEIAGTGRQSTFKPDARMKDNTAFVVVPHPQGDLFLEMQNVGERWLLHDLAIEPSSKDSTGIRNLSQMLKALNQSAQFLTGYQAADRELLQKTASKSFFNQCLSAAPLEEVPLPIPALLSSPYDARQFTDGGKTVSRMELLLKSDDKTYMLTIREEEPTLENGTKGNAEYRVDELTIFEKDDKDVKRLSSLFLTRSTVNLYLAALRNRDIQRLKELSSGDFNDRVWNRPEASHFAIMPYPVIASGEPEVIASVFRGDVSEVTVVLGETPMTLVLRLARGWMVVDDVMMPALNMPTSLKETLELELTLQAFAAAAHRGDLKALIYHSAAGLDDRVWRQLTTTPDLAGQLVKPMLSEVVEIQTGEPYTLICTSDGTVNAEVKLVREGTRYVVHDVSLIAADAPAKRLEFTQAMRDQIAAGIIGPAARAREADIQQAGGQTSAPNRVQQAVFEPIESNIYAR